MRRGISPIYARAIVFGLASAMYMTTARLLASNDPDDVLPAFLLAYGGATAAMGLMATFVTRLPVLRGRWTRAKGLWSRPPRLRELSSGSRLGSLGRPATQPVSF